MYKVSNEMTVSAIKADAKTRLMEDIINFLTEKYGADATGMVRFGSSSSKKNEFGVIVDEVDNMGEITQQVVTVNCTAKEPVNRRTDKRSYVAFDFEEAKNDYRIYMIDKDTKAAEKARAKAAKIEKDTAARKAKEEE